MLCMTLLQPTGWTMERQSKKGGVAPGKRVQKGSIIMYQVRMLCGS